MLSKGMQMARRWVPSPRNRDLARRRNADVPSLGSTEQKTPRSDWFYLGWATVAVASIVGPIALLHELQTDVSLREWVEGVDSSALTRIRKFVAVPYDESDDSRAAERPRDLATVEIVALHTSGKQTRHFVAAGDSETAVIGVLADPEDPVHELVSADVIREPHAATDALEVLGALFPPGGGTKITSPNALGVLHTRATLLDQISRIESELEAVRVGKTADDARPLAIGVCEEEQERLQAMLNESRERLAAFEVQRAVAVSGAAARAPPSQDAAIYFFTASESSRVSDRLAKIYRKLGVGTAAS